MRRLAWLFAAGAALFSASTVPANAGPADGNQLLVCEANRADVASVAVEDIRFGLEATYAWASANVHVTMRDGRVREYKISGRADPTDKSARPNEAKAGFTYPGFTCIVQYSSIVSVRNCSGVNARRSCEIGVTVFGMPMVYAVSLTAERNRIVEASTIP